MKADIITWIEKNKKIFEEIAIYLWENPELGLEEYEASARLINVLKQYGFAVETGMSGMPTAFIATFGKGTPVIAYNAEYDALPGLSQKCALDHKESILEGAPGQGCGHNILGTAEVFAAVALSVQMKKSGTQGTIKVFGSPAEELCVGKPFMARDGYYKKIDAFLDWHPWYYNKAHYDTCGAYFSVKYHFKGKTSHGNSPWEGRSAFDAAMLMGTAIEYLREHYEPAASDRGNTINYTFSDTGPEFPSVVPDKTTLWCLGRFNTSKQLKEIMRRIDNCAKAGAIATETTFEKEYITASHEKIPNEVLAKVVYDNFVSLGTPIFTEDEQNLAKAMQREAECEETGLDTKLQEFGTSGTVLCDTSEFSWQAPYATFWMTAAPTGGWHNWKVVSCVGSSIGLKTMIHAAKLLAVSGYDLFQNPQLVEKAKEEFEQRLEGLSYESLLPKEAKVPIHMNKKTMEKYRGGKIC